MPKQLSIAEINTKCKHRRIVGTYINTQTPTEFECLLCGTIAKILPVCAFGSVRPTCCAQKPSHDKYVKDLEKAGSRMRPTEPYLGRWKKTKHKCLDCENEKSVYPKHLLRGHGCFVCAKEAHSVTRYKRKVVKVGQTEHSLQGFEPQALELLVGYGANIDKIISDIAQGKPTVKYKCRGKERTYIPDFYYTPKNRIIEVKSIWTLGLKKHSEFVTNVAKAKACVRAGYDFTLLLLRKNGERIKLPKEWYNYPRKELLAFL